MSRHAYPKEWIHSKLEDVATIQTGIALNGKVSENTIRLPYLRVANVQDSHLDLSEIKYIDLPKDKVSRYTLQSGDVLLTEGGDFDKLGRGTIWKNEIPNCVHQNHIFVVRTDKNRLLPCFLEFISSSHIGRTYFLSCSKQTTNLASINSTQLKQMPLVIPTLPEQKKIAEILGIWDEGIEKTEKLIAAKQKLKKALMQQLLTGKKRFREFKREKWEAVLLGDVVTIIMGQSPNSTAYNNEQKGIPLIQGNADIESRRTCPKMWTIETTKKCKQGDIIMAVRAPVGEVALAVHDACIGRGVCSIRAKNIDNIYLFQYLLLYESKWLKYAQGSTFTAINSSDIRSLLIHIPCENKEQQRIAFVLNTADQEIELLQKQLESLKQQKKGLMQKLLTGKIRVKV